MLARLPAATTCRATATVIWRPRAVMIAASLMSFIALLLHVPIGDHADGSVVGPHHASPRGGPPAAEQAWCPSVARGCGPRITPRFDCLRVMAVGVPTKATAGRPLS